MENRAKANKERKCSCYRNFGCMDHNHGNRRNIGESKNRVCKKTIKVMVKIELERVDIQK